MSQNNISQSESVDIQVNILELNKLESSYAKLFKLLNDQEQARAEQLKIENKRLQFVLTRAVLKELLGKELGLSPIDIEFDYAEHGKPFISPETNPENIEFNVSHSNDYAAIAISNNIKLGVDIEQIRTGIEFEKLAQRFFSKIECEHILSLAEEEKQAAFFSIWSAKEAFIKAHGEGVGFGLDKFSVPFLSEKGKVQIDIEKDIKDAWHLENYSDIEGYSLAICANKLGLYINIQCY